VNRRAPHAGLGLGTPTPRGPAQARLFTPDAGKKAGDLVTLEAEVVRVGYENDETGFRVLRVVPDGGAERTLVGVMPPSPPGTRVRATGRIEVDPRHGEQLRVETLIAVAPATLAGLERFLGSGLAHGVGPIYAKRIVEAFGEETLDVLDHHPERLREVPGLGPKRAEQLEKAWEAHRAVGAIMIFLQSHGASPALAARIYKRFGPKAVPIVSASPYRLALDVWGVGFKTADRIARSLGISPDAPERAQAGVLHVLHERAGQGHVYTERLELADLAARMLEVDHVRTLEAIDELARSQRVRTEPLDEGTAVFDPELHEAESEIAARLAELLLAPPAGKLLEPLVDETVRAFEARVGVELAPAQREAIELCASRKVVVITGGPGVGKTTIVRAVLGLFDRGGLRTRLAAPTGRAAKRMSEATGREAVTLHRLLEFDPKARTFLRDDENPVDAGAFVIDESSMIDVQLMAALVRAIPRQARLVLVGDVDQLPSVGPGAVLRDVIDARVVPTSRLTAIFRQAKGSLIVENAHRIHEGMPPVTEQSATGEFYVIERKDDESAAEAIVEMIATRIPKRFGLDPRRDVQLLTPMHRGATGTIAMNERLQTLLNPSGPSVKVGQRLYRLGDKVMQLKNDYDREVYNGDVGFVTRIDEGERKLVVSFDEREVDYAEPDLDELALAYATSIHKSQGSEYPAVVIPFLMHHFVMLSRNLLYTAVTRGRKLVVLVADPRAISLGLAETRREARSTSLARRLRSLVAGDA
jgi:exodeoxyribonuclease V alpha subunit